MPVRFLLLGLGLTQAAGTHVITCNLSESALHNEIRSQECTMQYTGGGDDVQISEIFSEEDNIKRTLLPQTSYSTHIAPSQPFIPTRTLLHPFQSFTFQKPQTKLSSFPDIVYFNDTTGPYQASTQYLYSSAGDKVVTYCTPMGCSTHVGRTNIKTQYCIIGDKDTVKCSCKNPLPIGFLPGENVLGAICLSSQHDYSSGVTRTPELYYISPVPLSGVAEFHYREGHYQFDGPWNKKVLSPDGTVLTSESFMNSQVGKEGEEKEGDDDSGEYILTFYDRNKAAGRIGNFYLYDLSNHLGKYSNTFAISHNLHPMTDFTSSLYAVRTQNNLFLVNEKKQEGEEERKEGEKKKELYLSKVPEALWPLYEYEGENQGEDAVREKGPRIVIQSFRQEKMNPFTMGEGGKYGYINKAISISPIDLAIPMTGAHLLRSSQVIEWIEKDLWSLYVTSEELEDYLIKAILSWVEIKEEERRDLIKNTVLAIIHACGVLKGRLLASLALLDKIPLKDLKSSVPAIREGRQQTEEGNKIGEAQSDINFPELLEVVMEEAMKAVKEKAKEFVYRIDRAVSSKNNDGSSNKGVKDSIGEEEDPGISYIKSKINEWVDIHSSENIKMMMDYRIKVLFYGGGIEFYDIRVEERNARANGHARWEDELRREWIKKKYSKEEKEETVSHVKGQKDPQAAGPHKTPTSVVVEEKLENKDVEDVKGVIDGSKSDNEKDPKEKGKGRLVTVIICAVAVLIVVGGVIAIRSRNKSKQEEDPLLQNNSRLV